MELKNKWEVQSIVDIKDIVLVIEKRKRYHVHLLFKHLLLTIVLPDPLQL